MTEQELFKELQRQRKENERLSEHICELLKDKGELVDQVADLKEEVNKIAFARGELEAQIEKMKNCKNCKKLKKEKDGLLICTVGSFYTNTFGKNCDKWEIKENE